MENGTKIITQRPEPKVPAQGPEREDVALWR